ncbi:hypothetical protein COK56_01515 [Bacillus cereus]|uniref:hypothetical protein n=1 Tax=Bacillus cereus TaxID=1396 RepID=UPI000BEDAEDD|nr:hypothetical protein [Bacillus cereus]PEC54167.1 hypothetical protein CON05_12295 [Bacillus cereus]PFE42657.1 hypothetical protein CN317_23590 [Bacillus cereus]PFN15985.1 hypothetical protein COJ72_03685 [Bacillus cereus]PFS85147.1 hypothetical protein COK56_01515 [Bacillus cereus]
MKLLIEFKNQDIPLVVSSAPQEVLKVIAESKDDKLVFKNENLLLNEDFENIKSVTVTFE